MSPLVALATPAVKYSQAPIGTWRPRSRGGPKKRAWETAGMKVPGMVRYG